MARDARLAGDTVVSESCLQHIEHYVRLLEAAKRAEVARREEQVLWRDSANVSHLDTCIFT